jgi:hypothetical protein
VRLVEASVFQLVQVRKARTSAGVQPWLALLLGQLCYTDPSKRSPHDPFQTVVHSSIVYRENLFQKTSGDGALDHRQTAFQKQVVMVC